MSETARQPDPKNAGNAVESGQNRPPETPVNQVIGAITGADEAAAIERVAQLRDFYPEATPDALVGMLIKQKCLQSGAVGEVISSASILPGVGVFVSLIFGTAADVSMTARMQAELVLEIAAAYQRQLSQTEQERALIMVAGASEQTRHLLGQVGQQIAASASRQLNEQSTEKTTLQVAEAAGINIVSTYLIGQRAKTYFNLGPEAVEGWSESVQTLTGADQQLIVGWLSETTRRSWQLVRESARRATGIAIVAGAALGEVALTQAGRVVATAAGLGQDLARGVSVTTSTALSAGKKAGQGLISGVDKAAEVTGEAKRGLGKGTEVAGGLISEASKIAGRTIAYGLNTVGKFLKRG